MIPEQCVILLGGAGTRLGDLTREIPKPLLPVGGKPFVDVLVGEALRKGFRNILLLAGYKASVVQGYVDQLRSELPTGIEVKLSIEPEPLGTAGALAHAGDLLSERFLLLNGDTWFDFNWLDLAMQSLGECALAAREVPNADRYESLEIASDGRVSAIIPRGAVTGPVPVNGGVYILSKAELSGFPSRFSIEEDLLPRLATESKLRTKIYRGFFLDIGIPDTFEAAQKEVPEHRRRSAIFFDRDGVLNHDDRHVGSRERFRWMDGAKEAVRLANDLGYYVFVVTNQAGVAHGLYSESDVQDLHDWIGSELRREGAWIDDWRYCPFHPEAAIQRYRTAHPWRKPEPGMLLDLIETWPVERKGSILFGDQESDCAAAEAAGIKSVLFKSGNLYDVLSSHLQTVTFGR